VPDVTTPRPSSMASVTELNWQVRQMDVRAIMLIIMAGEDGSTFNWDNNTPVLNKNSQLTMTTSLVGCKRPLLRGYLM